MDTALCEESFESKLCSKDGIQTGDSCQSRVRY